MHRVNHGTPLGFRRWRGGILAHFCTTFPPRLPLSLQGASS